MSLAVFSSSHVMGTPGAVSLAEAAAIKRTSQLAQTAGVPAQILAAGGKPYRQGPSPAAIPTAATTALDNLFKSANNACFVERDPQKCSIYNQELASVEASLTCPGGPEAISAQAQKQQGSMWRWLYPPTYVSAVKPTTTEVASVAVALGALQVSE